MKNFKYLSFIFVFFLSTGVLVCVQLCGMRNKQISKNKVNHISNEKEVAFIFDLKYGLFSHYVWAGGSGTTDQSGKPAKNIQEQINTFDVSQYVRDCKTFSVQYVIFTAWHARMNPLYYSPVYRKWRDNADKNNPDKNDRDIIAELANALKITY